MLRSMIQIMWRYVVHFYKHRSEQCYHVHGTIYVFTNIPIKTCRLWERPEKEIAVVSHGIFLQQTLRALHEKVSIPLEDSLLTRSTIRFPKLINQLLVNLFVLTCN